jgi:hypothetical protein
MTVMYDAVTMLCGAVTMLSDAVTMLCDAVTMLCDAVAVLWCYRDAVILVLYSVGSVLCDAMRGSTRGATHFHGGHLVERKVS